MSPLEKSKNVFLSLQLIDNQEYVFVKLTFSSGLKIQVSQVF